MAQNFYCIYVYLAEKNRAQFESEYGKYFDEIIFVDLKDPQFQNGFYEFSGYQNGLTALSWFHETIYNIILINDTFMNGHISLCRTIVLRYLLAALSEIKGLSILGIPNRTVEQSFLHSVSTWCFALRLRKGDIKEFDFTCGYAGQYDALDKLETIYPAQRALIHKWLYPSSFFRGWHNAPYFYDIRAEDHKRKSISILLEHQFISYNADKIASVHSLSSLQSSYRDKIYSIVRLLDRAHLNYRKITFRMGCLVRFLLRSYLR